MALINLKDSKSFKYVVIITSLLLAFTAAYYSIVGFSAISGGDIAVIIMSSMLEVSKIVTISLLYRYWEDLAKSLKYYLVIGTVILMLFTSIGIYGYLTGTFQTTQNQITVVEIEKEKSRMKIDQFQASISSLEEQKQMKIKRVEIIQKQRTDQENRVSSLYDSENFYSARKASQLIENSDKQVNQLQTEIDDIVNKIFPLQDSINVYKTLNSNIDIESNISSEASSLQYLSNLLDVPLNVIFNYYILLIILVFDPLALALILTGNFISEFQLKNQENSPIIPVIPPEIEEIQPEIVEKPQVIPENAGLKKVKKPKPDENIYNEKIKKVATEAKKQYVDRTIQFDDGSSSSHIEEVPVTPKNISYGNSVNP